jgi:cytochrome c6
MSRLRLTKTSPAFHRRSSLLSGCGKPGGPGATGLAFLTILGEPGGRLSQANTKNNQSNRYSKTHMKKLMILAAAMSVAFALSAKAADANENWSSHCAKCHGADGKGETKMGKKAGCKDYTSAAVQAAMKDDAAFKAVKEGLKVDGKEVMKPFGEKLSDEEIKALIAHMRTFKK